MASKKQDKRSALLRSALELFAEQGFNASSTAHIARHAGVASGTLFFHFQSKEELIHEIFRQVRSKIEADVLATIPAEMPVRERFFRIFTQLLRYFLDNPEEFKFVEQYHYSPFSERGDHVSDKQEPFKDLLLQAREQQLIKDAPLLFLEAVAFGPIAALAKEHANHGTFVDDDIVRLTIEACWDGLKN